MGCWFLRRGFFEIIYYYLKEARSITLGSGAAFPGIVGKKKKKKRGRSGNSLFWSKGTGREGRAGIPSRPRGDRDGEGDKDRDTQRFHGSARGSQAGSKGDPAGAQGSVTQGARVHPPIHLGGADPSTKSFFFPEGLGMDPGTVPGQNRRG